jgi:hypothetical protein
MATEIYESATVYLTDGTELYITPLKIKYLRQFMQKFLESGVQKSESETIDMLSECVAIAMKQYYPSIKTIDDVQDSIDIETLYKIVEVSSGVKLKDSKESSSNANQPSSKNNKPKSETTWETLDLAKLESEVFLIGKWKDYEDLETCLSMPELVATLQASRELSYNDKKFMAGLQGVDLDKESGKTDEWEEMKARVFGNGNAANANDIVALQGQSAVKAGFGIGMGLDYERID